MTVAQAETLLQPTGLTIALRHRFAFDTGTILRLDNYAMINIFDDGRYYIQEDATGALIALFGAVEAPWDPETCDARISLPPGFPARRPLG
jgi:hypothetical protein